MKGRRIRELTSVVQKRFKFPEGSVELYAEKVNNRGLCAIAQAESLRYKLLGGLAVRRWGAPATLLGKCHPPTVLRAAGALHACAAAYPLLCQLPIAFPQPDSHPFASAGSWSSCMAFLHAWTSCMARAAPA